MRLDDERESTNVEVQSGSRSGFGFPRSGGGLRVGGGKMGCGTIIIILIAVFVFKVDPGALLGDGGMEMSPQQQTAPSGEPGQLTPIQSVGAKVRYPAPRLVYYNREGNSGCGAAQSAMGPFYCPADQKIYIDTTFFEELRTRFGVDGDFPMAYVIAHEVGHHIQTITGTSEKVRRAQERVSRVEGNRLQVAMELQADCYAGVWARNDTNLLEPGDIEEGLRAAEAIGDDTLQRASQGVVVPESFTHGSSQQRMAWLKRGLDTGDPAQCNTFGG
jgi:uncharacterized protein